MKKGKYLLAALGLAFMLTFPAYADETTSIAEVPQEAQELIQKYQENQEDVRTYLSVTNFLLPAGIGMIAVGYYLDCRKKRKEESEKKINRTKQKNNETER